MIWGTFWANLWLAPHIRDEETGRSVGNLIVQNKQINTPASNNKAKNSMVLVADSARTHYKSTTTSQKYWSANLKMWGQLLNRYRSYLCTHIFIKQPHFWVEVSICYRYCLKWGSKLLWNVRPFEVEIERPKNIKDRQIWCFRHLVSVSNFSPFIKDQKMKMWLLKF